MAQLQIPAVSSFQPHGDQNTVAQRWNKWKKSFNYLLAASGVTEGTRKKALLLHLIGTETRDIYDTLTLASASFEDELTHCPTIVNQRKILHLNDQYFIFPHNIKTRQLINMSQDSDNYHFTANIVQKQTTTLEIN